MAKFEKPFNTKIYAVIIFFLMAGFLVGITTGTFASRYNGFAPEKVAKAYAESIINRGDGYNAYKNSIISKNFKYGDFIREYYMYPVIYRNTDYKPLDSRDGLKGYNDDSFKGEKTLNDTGALAGQVIDKMYPYYESLVESQHGWDDYDYIFTNYFNMLVEVRKEIFGDDYMTDEIMFTALESNVSTYGDKLTGTENKVDENTGVQLSEKTIGEYEKAYGENYKLECKVVNVQTSEDVDNFKEKLDKSLYEKYDFNIDDITQMGTCMVNVYANGECVAEQIPIFVVKIGDTWYVDNTRTKTNRLYDFYK